MSTPIGVSPPDVQKPAQGGLRKFLDAFFDYTVKLYHPCQVNSLDVQERPSTSISAKATRWLLAMAPANGLTTTACNLTRVADTGGRVRTLLPLSFTLPTAAMPRERPFSRGSSTGALGHEPPVSPASQITRNRSFALVWYGLHFRSVDP